LENKKGLKPPSKKVTSLDLELTVLGQKVLSSEMTQLTVLEPLRDQT
jgi:hypothetical protein